MNRYKTTAGVPITRGSKGTLAEESTQQKRHQNGSLLVSVSPKVSKTLKGGTIQGELYVCSSENTDSDIPLKSQ